MNLEVKLAYYRKEDWDKLMNSIVDRGSMHDTWEEWNREYTKAKASLRKEGFVVHEMTIDIDDLNRYCMDEKLVNNGKTRSRYVQQLPLIGRK